MKKIYTFRGDTGKSSTLDGESHRKSDPVFEALGTLDELNSALGIVYSFTENDEVKDSLRWIQNKLYICMSNIASSGNADIKSELQIKEITSGDTVQLEKWIDEITEKLPELSAFIMPGGDKASAFAHSARSICRRAERRIAGYKEVKQVDPEIVKFVNRLSDYLFTIARLLDSNL